jgi:hypothetical protein
MRAYREPTKLILELADGTVRHMNYENWGSTVQLTEQKVFSLRAGTPIRIATWLDYDPAKWFCDVEEMVDPASSSDTTESAQ